MSISVVLADDHLIFRQGLAALLRAEPDVSLLAEAADGEAAWDLIERLVPDVAVLDLSMPGATGIEVARRVELAALDTRVLLLTMHGDPSLALQALDAGAAGYLLKDNSFEELVLSVRTLAAGGTFLTPSIRAKVNALRRGGHKPVDLSARERQVAKLIAEGQSTKEIARLLGISPRTVETYRNRLMEKLGLRSIADVVRWAVQGGVVD